MRVIAQQSTTVPRLSSERRRPRAGTTPWNRRVSGKRQTEFAPDIEQRANELDDQRVVMEGTGACIRLT